MKKITIMMIITLSMIYWQVPINAEKVGAKTTTINTTIIEKEWDNVFGGNNNDVASSMIQTTDGGYVLAGQTSSYGAGSLDMWLVKVISFEDTDRKFSSSWTPIIVILSLTTLIFKKRKRVE
jgi:hypothetical protein